MGLRWGQVSFTRKSIILPETKNGEARALPREGLAFDLMLSRSKVRRIDTDLVFPAHNSTQPILLRKPFATALRRASVPNFRWHDLRHTAACYMAMSGHSLLTIKEFLGHKTLDMVIRYAHLSELHTQQAVKDMNAKHFGAASL
jgi:integrase